MTREPALTAYLAEAASWDADRQAQAQRVVRISMWVAGAGWLCASVALLALMMLKAPGEVLNTLM
jgi:type IV secretory pathway component VirB8